MYKYRPFDKYTFDMLENNYVFLCAACDLDDPSECVVTTDIDDYFDEQKKVINFDIINNMLQFIRLYTSQENYEVTFSKIQEIYNVSSSYEEFMNTLFGTLQNVAGDVDISNVINFIKDLPTSIDNSPQKEKYEQIIKDLIDARKKVGVCSLAETSDIKDMWINYAKDYSGYCIEYDMEGYDYSKFLMPVIYENQKETDLIKAIVKNILGQTIFTLSGEKVEIERNHILKLLTTKDLKWSYQKEWRLVGNANGRLSAPRIKRIILGSNVDESNKEKIIEVCKSLRINVETLK